MTGERTIERLRRELAIAKRRLEWEAEHNQHTTAWAHKAFEEQNRLRDRCTFLYGKAIEHGATCDELRAGLLKLEPPAVAGSLREEPSHGR